MFRTVFAGCRAAQSPETAMAISLKPLDQQVMVITGTLERDRPGNGPRGGPPGC
jgi:hypothetical protein